MASILVVCTGNVCRSPIAEAALRAKLTARFGDRAPDVSSAGIAGWEGSAAVPETVQAAAERGLDVASHVACTLTPSMLEETDLVVCMAAEHREAIGALAPQAVARTFTLKELVRLVEQLRPAPADAGPDSLAERVTEAAATRTAGADTNPNDQDVADPLGLSLETFRAVAWELDEYVERLLAGVYGPAPAG